ncbi:hypothetical protein EVAR_12779_1 [Eumeta japonica]|uniref:Uncharacterized protein n=1 Tax=Eumeta variegata TaxID=151549 RepID=A0A4C1UB01_EUMVA|nr:hypothetical protein EVAR_12779_1 [Eumeta japonica]
MSLYLVALCIPGSQSDVKAIEAIGLLQVSVKLVGFAAREAPPPRADSRLHSMRFHLRGPRPTNGRTSTAAVGGRRARVSLGHSQRSTRSTTE